MSNFQLKSFIFLGFLLFSIPKAYGMEEDREASSCLSVAQTLPAEVLGPILELTVDDYNNLGRKGTSFLRPSHVCKLWREVFADVLRHKVVDIENSYQDDNNLEKILSSLKESPVRVIRIYPSTEKILSTVLVFPKLERLEISGSSIFPTKDAFKKANLPALKSLSISFMRVGGSAFSQGDFPVLERLKLHSCSLHNKGIVKVLGSNLPALQHFTSGCHTIRELPRGAFDHIILPSLSKFTWTSSHLTVPQLVNLASIKASNLLLLKLNVEKDEELLPALELYSTLSKSGPRIKVVP